MASDLFRDLPPAAPIHSGGRQLNVRRIGDGPRLLLLHGGPGLDHHLVLPLGIALAESFEVWMPDLPGHGRSHVEGRGLPDLNRLVDTTARWVEHLDPPPAVVGGHSLGAFVARDILARGRIAPGAWLLISPPGLAGVDAATRVRRPEPWRERRAATRPSARLLREQVLEFCVDDTPSIHPSAELTEAVRLAHLRPPVVYGPLSGQLRARLRESRRCGRPRSPVLVLRGEYDTIGTRSGVDALVEATPGATLRVLENAGHVPYAADAAPVADAVRRFLVAECGLGPSPRARD